MSEMFRFIAKSPKLGTELQGSLNDIFFFILTVDDFFIADPAIDGSRLL